MEVDLRAVNVARLISELEGSYALMKYMGLEEDMATVGELKSKYYKLYGQLKKSEAAASANFPQT